MSETIRQNNLFAAEDWKVVYNAYRNVDLTAYDYNSIYEAMVNYLKVNNPEEFNDYIRNSEMLAHINMIAYLGQALAFRIDLNVRETFFDTASRRESVIRLADALSYKTKRNRTANGHCKLSSIRTTQPILDSQGVSLANRTVTWNQSSDVNWYDNFIKILNASFSSTNPFGNPLKDISINSTLHQLYPIERPMNSDVAFPFTENINGTNYTFEAVSSDIKDTTISELHPSSTIPFNILYKNDGNGNTSTNTGFFVQIKQGRLNTRDVLYSNPEVDIIESLTDSNINNTDVWVQEIDAAGKPIKNWTEVSSLVGQNIVYNDIFLRNRTIFATKSKTNNQVDILFSDGEFGDLPVGTFRFWYRTSSNEQYIIRPNDIFNKAVTIPYIGFDGQRYELTFTFTSLETIQNAEPEENIEDIKRNAPLVHYSQDRMVNAEDYNVYPLTQTNTIKKIKTVNRTHAGHSRYIDINDPTGAHESITVLGRDAYLYSEYKKSVSVNTIQSNTNFKTLVASNIEEMISSIEFRNFVLYDVRKTILSEPSDNIGGLGKDYFSYTDFPNIIWVTLPNNSSGGRGYFSKPTTNAYTNVRELESIRIGQGSSTKETKLLRPSTKVLLEDQEGKRQWVTISQVENFGLVNESITTYGPVTLSSDIATNAKVIEVIPSIRGNFSNDETVNITHVLQQNNNFGLRYDIIEDRWYTINSDNMANTNDNFDLKSPSSPSSADNRWLFKATVNASNSNRYYTFESKGTKFIFGSSKQVQFYFVEDSNMIDYKTGKEVSDHVTILSSNMSNASNGKDIKIANRTNITTTKF